VGEKDQVPPERGEVIAISWVAAQCGNQGHPGGRKNTPVLSLGLERARNKWVLRGVFSDWRKDKRVFHIREAR